MKNSSYAKKELGRFALIGFAIVSAVAAVAHLSPGFRELPSPTRSVDAGSEFECSNATLRGSYSFTSQGWVPNGPPQSPLVPFATANRMSLDGNGGIVNDTTVSRNGQIIRNVGKGTYSIGKNCKGR